MIDLRGSNQQPSSLNDAHESNLQTSFFLELAQRGNQTTIFARFRSAFWKAPVSLNERVRIREL
jgi:hypothetical protein